MHKNAKTTQQFTQEILDKFGLILQTEYKGAKTKCTVKGPCGHTWDVIPSNLLCKGNRKDCRVCAGVVPEYTKWDDDNLNKLLDGIEQNLSIEELAELLGSSVYAVNKTIEVYGFSRKDYLLKTRVLPNMHKQLELAKYTLISPEPLNNSEKITYICNKGHTYTQGVASFLQGHRCGTCHSAVSKGEIEVRDFILGILPEGTWCIPQERSILNNGRDLDMVFPDYGIAVEYNGHYFHREEKRDKDFHIGKLSLVEGIEFRLIQVTDEEWLFKNSIVKSRLRTIFGFSDVIYARKCTVRDITYKECSTFCETNHIQGGNAKTSVNTGLFSGEELVAVMSLCMSRFSDAYEYELVRYCSKLEHSVVGGASKLLKYFERNHNPISVGSYSDRRWNTGGLYLKLGFTFIHNSAPDYVYVYNGKSFNRQQFQKHKLQALFPEIYSDEKTEREIMEEAGYYRVFGCGSALFIKEYK